jgi:hypothetical protein
MTATDDRRTDSLDIGFPHCAAPANQALTNYWG